MDQQELQKRVEAFLAELDIPSFIVFGFQKSETEFGFVSSYHQIPTTVAIKGLTWALNHFVSQMP